MGFIRDSDNDGSIVDDAINTAAVIGGSGLIGAGMMLGAGGAALATFGLPASIVPPAGLTAAGAGAAIGLGGAGVGAAGTMLAGLGGTGVLGEMGQAGIGAVSGAAESVHDFFMPPPKVAPGT